MKGDKLDAPFIVERVEIEYADESARRKGLKGWIDAIKRGIATKSWINDKIIVDPLLGSYQDIDAFYNKLKLVLNDLRALGCQTNDFKFELDVSKKSLLESLTTAPSRCVLKSIIRKKNQLEMKVNVSNEGHKAAVQASINLKNYFGGYETISGSYMTTSGKSRYNFDFQKMLLNYPVGERSIHFRVTNLVHDYSKVSSFIEHQILISPSYQMGRHQFGYEAAFKNTDIMPESDECITFEGGSHLKSSIYYNWIKDTRDSRLIPTKGSRIVLSTELAGLIGDVYHVKGEVNSNINYKLSSTCAFHLIARAGTLKSLFGTTSKISDRFSFSETNPFYGFRYYGVGPRLGRGHYRGDHYWTLAMHFTYRMFEHAASSIFARSFCQIGSCFGTTQDQGMCNWLSRSGGCDLIRASVGLGVSAKFAFAQLDLLYSIPLLFSSRDQPKRWYFGICADFL
ncbi:uncharacterized protein LOC126324045 [Schistocerca gregaria]|uniref:uncharacterized protein LOC126324045 n=1 Tax=Schistocerca gregaria TaxID=7010 RepID=UPI00211E102E|nr:uncharacterized protein LOC126324045 [Schistocerca gregaria]